MSNEETTVVDHYLLTGRAHVAIQHYCDVCQPCDGHWSARWGGYRQDIDVQDVYQLHGKTVIDRGGGFSPAEVMRFALADSSQFADYPDFEILEVSDVELTPVYALPIDAQLRLAGVPGLFEVQP